jgi:hypothetical protein
LRIAKLFVSRLLFAILLLSAAIQTPATPAQPPGNNTSGEPAAPGGPDPATTSFSTDVGLLLVAVKPDKVADYEDAIRALQDAFSKTADLRLRAIADGWHVFKAADADAKANALYVHLMQPAIKGEDYRPSLLLDELLAGAPPELLAKYRDSFAGPPTRLSLTELAHMILAPAPKPANGSPPAPAPPKPPGW